MGEKRTIIVLGAGHLAVKTRRRFEREGYDVAYIADNRADHDSELRFENTERMLKKHDLSKVAAICVVDSEDSANLDFALVALSMSNTVKVYVSLHDNNLAEYLKKVHPTQLHIFNPSAIAAPYLVERLMEAQGAPASRAQERTPASRRKPDMMLWAVGAMFITLFTASTIFFHHSEQLSWLDAAYFTAVTVTTVGYGDISLKSSSDAAKIFAIFLTLASLVLVWVFFSFVIDRLNKKRYDIEMGRKRYSLKGHVIVCGLGRVGTGVTAALTEQKRKVLAIEADKDGRFLDIARSRGVHVFIGDASLSKNLLDAGVRRAAGVIVAVDDDQKSMEIGLNAKSLNPDIPVVFRIFHEDLAEKLRSELGIKQAYSTTAIAAEHLVSAIHADEHAKA